MSTREPSFSSRATFHRGSKMTPIRPTAHWRSATPLDAVMRPVTETLVRLLLRSRSVRTITGRFSHDSPANRSLEKAAGRRQCGPDPMLSWTLQFITAMIAYALN